MTFENIINILFYNLDYKIIIKLLSISKTINNDIKLIINSKLNQIHTYIIINKNIIIQYNEKETENYNKYIYNCKQLKLLELYNKYKYNYCNEIITINILNELVLRTMPNIYSNYERELDIQSLVYFGANINTIHINNYKNIIDLEKNIIDQKKNSIFQNIVIPSIITSIDVCAFYKCKLKSVIFHDAIINIGHSAFYNNELTFVKIPPLINTIKSRAFSHNKIKKVILHDNIINIDISAFCHNKLTNITIPPYCSFIGSYAFNDNLLEKIIIPSYMRYIGSFAFCNNKITSVVIDKYYNDNDNNTIYELCLNNFAFQNNKISILNIKHDNIICKTGVFANNLLTNI